ncbi:MAG TPA: hypothetical protein P5567_15340 [Kiritimatiellia bacterium]|nr:hypothetical protein [Kiritimatiellia bacterium]HRZ13816.1 hypothetical protein [Kiritimatiellia bacterium]HSA19437.1 hypothetical protein [Kiritimatiellia bacterium]
MRFFKWGRHEEASDAQYTGVMALKELWGIGEEKKSFKPLTAPVCTDIYHVPTVLNIVPRRRPSRH